VGCLPDPTDDQKRDERSDRLVGVLVPIAVALILIGAALAERGPVDRDLRLVAPRAARAGDPVPVRALLLAGSNPPAAVNDATVEVVLRGVEGTDQSVVARGVLQPSAVGYEGALEVPGELEGTWQLFATARAGDDDPAEVRRRIQIGAAGPGPRRGRLQTELQRYELGATIGSAPPSELEARVVGGDCTNHAPCELVVWVGGEPAEVALEAGRGARETGCEPGESDGFVRCTVVVRGNEATVQILARRGGAEVGRRRLQLPMGSPAPAVHRERALVPVGDRPTLEVHGLDERYVVDLFHEGRWQRSATLAPEDQRLALPWALDAPGLWRAQVRRDAFGSNSSAVVTWWVSAEEPAAALAGLAGHPRQNDWLDPLASAVRDGELHCTSRCEPERVATALLAAGELEVLTYPRSSSGAEQASAGIRTVQWGRRGVAATLIFLAGLLVAFVVHRRARAAGEEARRILAAAHETDDEVPPAPRRDALPAASAAFLVLLFAVVAAIILARGCLMG